MKIFRLFVFFFAVSLFTACSENGTTEPPQKPAHKESYDAWYEITSSRSYNLDAYCDMLIKDAVPPSAQFMARMMMAQVKAKLPKEMTFDIYNFKFKSTDGTNNDVILSGQVIVPKVFGVMISDKMVFDNRFTQLKNTEIPTNKLNVGASIALTCTPVATCDMLGYGSSIGKTLNYHCYDIGAKNSVDAAMAAATILHSSELGLNLGDKILQIYNEGYSQGGYGALSFMKYMQEDATDKEKKLLPVVKTVCGAGAYDMDVFLDDIFEDEEGMYPYYCYVMAAFITGTHYHQDVFKGTTISDMLTGKANASRLVDMVNSKEYDTAEMCEAFALAMDNDYRPSQVFAPELLNADGKYRKMVAEASAKESLIRNWTPKGLLHIYHAKNDDAVTVKCADAARRAFGSGPDNNITYDIDKDVTTVMGVTFSLSPHMMGYFNFIFDNIISDLAPAANPL